MSLFLNIDHVARNDILLKKFSIDKFSKCCQADSLGLWPQNFVSTKDFPLNKKA